VTELGDVLELLSGAGRSWTTVRAVASVWSHRERSKEAIVHHLREQRAPEPGVARRVDARGLREADEWVAKVWVARPDRTHVEYEGRGIVPLQKRVSSVNGRPVSVPEPTPIDHLLDPSDIVAALVDLAVVGRGEVAGRPVRLVTADPRPLRFGERGPFRGLAPGADRYLLSVDDERGVVLRLEAELHGDPYLITEITEIAFDEDLPEEIFAREPRAVDPPRPEGMSIEEAARRAPFTVLVPTRVPEDARLFVRLMPAFGPRPLLVTLSYAFAASLHHLQLTESAEADGRSDAAPWVEEEHDGQLLWVLDSAGGSSGRSAIQVKLVRQGTEVRITSDLGLDLIRAVALSLVPAPTEPPTLPD
jgi:hypothetical protein